MISSCGTNQQTIKESERDAIIDSMVAQRMEEITRQAVEDLDRRRSIEVKAKADSIVTAKDSLQASSGNASKPTLP